MEQFQMPIIADNIESCQRYLYHSEMAINYWERQKNKDYYSWDKYPCYNDKFIDKNIEFFTKIKKECESKIAKLIKR